MAMDGADLEQLLALSKRFGTDHDTLQTLFSNLNSASDSSHGYWSGDLANRFRDDWKSLQPHLTKIVQVLHDAQVATKTHHANISMATRGH
jgi:WXG100 family type VII secretion target